MAKMAQLTAGLVAKKGEAVPALVTRSIAEETLVQAEPLKTPPSAGADYYKSLTVKLDRQRYESLKGAGLKLDKKSQMIMVEALDLWLKSTGNAK